MVFLLGLTQKARHVQELAVKLNPLADASLKVRTEGAVKDDIGREQTLIGIED